jgi:hypothetical protein
MQAVGERPGRLCQSQPGDRKEWEENAQLLFISDAPKLLGAIVRYQHTAIRQDE